MKSLLNVSYGKHPANCLDIHLPDEDVRAVFVYFHGGGFERGDKERAQIFAPFLTTSGVAVISANYRMYPEAKYPDFIYDAAECVRWSLDYMKKNLNCNKLYVGGSSAGGYLSMMLCFNKYYLNNVGLSNDDISGYFHDAGQPTAHFNVLKEKGIDHRRVIVDESAPLYYIGMDEDYPPMRFIVSDNDIKSRYEQTMLVMSTLSHFGHEKFDHIVMHGGHCQYCREQDESGNGILGKMVYDFIEWAEKYF